MHLIARIYKNAYTGLSPATWWLSLVMLINRSGTMVVPFTTLYLTESEHRTLSEAGLVMALFGAGAICGGLLGGWLVDRFGFYYIQLSALLCGGAMFIALGQIHHFPTLCVITFFLAVLNESFRPANSAAIAQYSKPENRTRSYSLNRLAINLGWSAGGALGGLIATHNYSLLFWIDGCTNVVAAVMLRFFLAPSKNALTPPPKDRSLPKVRGRSPWSDGPYMFFILLTILFAFCFYQLFTTLPVYYRRVVHLSPGGIGYIMAMNGLIIATVEMALVFALEQKKKNLLFIAAGAACVGVSFFLYNIFPSIVHVAVISMLFVTLGEMLSMPFMNSFMVSRTDPNNRGQYAGLFTVAWSVAQVLGPFSGTRIAEHLGFTTLWWIIGSVGMLCALGFLVLRQRMNN